MGLVNNWWDGRPQVAMHRTDYERCARGCQMVYHDLTGRWSFGLYVDDREVAKCLSSEQLRDAGSLHPSSHGVYQQCNSVTTLYVDELQSLKVRCMYGSRTILTQPEFTFWGIVKLS